MQPDFSLIESILWASKPFWPRHSSHAAGPFQQEAGVAGGPGITDFIFSAERLQGCSWQEQCGSWKNRFFLFSRHMARISDSAAHFGFCFDRDIMLSELERTGSRLESTHCSEYPVNVLAQYKVRLVLSPSGRVDVDYTPVSPVEGLPVCFDISGHPSEQKTPFPAHKTSLRRIFDMELRRATSQGLFDTVFVDRKGQVTEGTFTNLFVDMGDGMLLTPPLGSGVLPGTLRAELISVGLARQETVSLPMLEEAKAVYLGNSVRGLLPARLKSNHAA